MPPPRQAGGVASPRSATADATPSPTAAAEACVDVSCGLRSRVPGSTSDNSLLLRGSPSLSEQLIERAPVQETSGRNDGANAAHIRDVFRRVRTRRRALESARRADAQAFRKTAGMHQGDTERRLNTLSTRDRLPIGAQCSTCPRRRPLG